jgi:uncharacterized membrane protein YraQ (UPF0718 family)
MKSVARALEPFLLWILFSLLAIAFVGTRTYLALVIALLGGIAMGLSSLSGYLPSPQHSDREGDGSGGES